MRSMITAAVLSAAFAFTAQAAPVDLSSWTAEGSGTWNLQSGNNAVLQTQNAGATVFHNGLNSQGFQLSGTIQVNTSSDDDFIGFVLGYHAGDLFATNPDYLVIDWKQADQTLGSGSTAAVGNRGLAISRVTGPIGNSSSTSTQFRDAWGHQGVVEELQRASTLGDVGWVNFQQYTFDLVFQANRVQVFVDGNLELDVSGSFANGAFGFYNMSQAQVLYAGIQESVAPIPLPAALPLLLTGIAGLGLVRVLRRRQAA